MNAVVEAYRAQQVPTLQELITAHQPLVRRIAYHLLARLPSSVEVDDLLQAGQLGLIEAAQHFRSDAGASFATFAGIRIRGAMLDELRKGDWVPRSVHRRARELADAMRRVEARTGQKRPMPTSPRNWASASANTTSMSKTPRVHRCCRWTAQPRPTRRFSSALPITTHPKAICCATTSNRHWHAVSTSCPSAKSWS